ncbi:hypothetical protein [Umezakia ovalisporum]|uniref:hypothetical protein n=1 Tax=Umezakia ovalisporum TaxID=75695 RepID=UPI002476A6E2|nr:hypothetical protein [Umezakia ovalisporum]MDH6083610.1 hypothetical protein [Umezakia ovalisporum TAC611]
MFNYRPSSNNCLLALEQELLEKKRLFEEFQGQQDITDGKTNQIYRGGNKQDTNNRLLELEQELLERYSSKKINHKTSETYSLRVEPDNSDGLINHNNRLLALEQELLGQGHKPHKRKRKSKHSGVKSQVFDTGESIILQYNSEAFPVALGQIATISVLPEVADDFSNSKSPFLAETEVSPKIETLEPDLLASLYKEISKPQISEQMSQEIKNSLSQSAEFVSEIDAPSYPLQPEDIPAILAELKTDSQGTPATPISSQKEAKSDGEVVVVGDRNNPHAIFDRMGKNMAYATTFDVGTIELEQLFDEFNRTLDQQEQLNQGDSLSQTQGNLELEQRFDELDRALQLEQQVNQSDSVFHKQGDLELEQRLSEFDRTLEQQEKGTTPIEPNPQTKSPLKRISEKTDAGTQEQGNTKTTETAKITSKLGTEAIQNQNQQSIIAPLASRPVELLQPSSHVTKFHPNTSRKFDFNLEGLVFHTGINIISLIMQLLNFIRRNQIPLQPDIDSQPILSVIPYGDGIKSELENPNSQVIDIRQNDFIDGILPLILSSQKSSFMTTSTPVDGLTADRDSLTGLLYGEFSGHNSYPLTDYSNVIKAENKSNPNKSNLHEKPCHPPKEGKNDSS